MGTDLRIFRVEEIQLNLVVIICRLRFKGRKDIVWRDLILGIIVQNLISLIILTYLKKHQDLPSIRKINNKLRALKLTV